VIGNAELLTDQNITLDRADLSVQGFGGIEFWFCMGCANGISGLCLRCDALTNQQAHRDSFRCFPWHTGDKTFLTEDDAGMAGYSAAQCIVRNLLTIETH
jgi:hypothetical protein